MIVLKKFSYGNNVPSVNEVVANKACGDLGATRNACFPKITTRDEMTR